MTPTSTKGTGYQIQASKHQASKPSGSKCGQHLLLFKECCGDRHSRALLLLRARAGGRRECVGDEGTPRLPGRCPSAARRVPFLHPSAEARAPNKIGFIRQPDSRYVRNRSIWHPTAARQNRTPIHQRRRPLRVSASCRFKRACIS